MRRAPRSLCLAALACLALLAPALALATPPPPAQPAAPPPPPAPTGEVHVPSDQVLTTALPDGVVVTFEPGTDGALGRRGQARERDREVDARLPPRADRRRDRRHDASARRHERRARVPRLDARRHAHRLARPDARRGARRHDRRRRLRGRRSSSARTGRASPSRTRTALVLHKGGDADKSRAAPRRAELGRRRRAARRRSPSWPRAPARWSASRGRPPRARRATACEVGTDAGMTQIVAERRDRRRALLARRRPGPASTSSLACAPSAPRGIVGAWSPPRALRVLHFRLPSGAFVARDGVVVLPDGAFAAPRRRRRRRGGLRERAPRRPARRARPLLVEARRRRCA